MYINDRDEAERVITQLLKEEVLAFDLETQPHFPYPRERKKSEYIKYWQFLNWNRWGLRYSLTPEEVLETQVMPAAVDPFEEAARVQALIEKERRGKKTATKTAQKRIELYENVLSALEQPIVPAWVLRHIASLLAGDAVSSDPVRPGLDPRTTDIFLIQFTTATGAAYCFNAKRVGLDIFIPIFENVHLVGANLTFDIQFIVHATGVFPRVAWDVTVADRVLTLGLDFKHHLAEICERWIGETLDKSVRETFATPYALEPTAEQVRYALKDVEVLFPIYHKQRATAETLEMEEAVRLFIDLTVPTAAIEYCGLQIDKERWLEIAAEAERRLTAASEAFAEYLGVEPEDLTKRNVVLAAAQMRGIDTSTLNKTELGEVERRYAGDEDKERFFALYNEWSKWQKRVSTYGRSFLHHIHPITGRIHPNLKIAGADTGRYASSEPNILNLPRGDDGDLDFRSAIVAPDGYVFANADYAAMEQRITADISGDPALLSLFAAGGDNHSVTAALMFHTRRGDVAEPQSATFEFQHKRIEGYVVSNEWNAQQLVGFIINSGLADKISKEYKKTTRQVAKVVAFLYFYGGTEVGLAKKLHITTEQAAQFFRDFRAAYPVLARWFAENGKAPFRNAVRLKDGTRAGYITTYAGLRRWFALPQPAVDRNDERREWRERAIIERAAKNHPCQGGNAVVMARAIRNLWKVNDQPREGGLEATLGIERMVVAPIYDEVLLLVPEGTTQEEADRIIVEAMEEAGNAYMKNCRAVAEPNPLSKNWRKF